MELEKLKEIWTSLDNRMQQQEVMKTTLIKEMLINKSDKALSQLINYSYFGLILVISGIPFMIWTWQQLPGIVNNVLIPIIIAFLLFGLITGIIQLVNLHKINLSAPINQNIFLVQKTNIFNKRISLISYIIAAILLVTVIIIMLNSPWIQPWRWFVFITVILVSAIGGYWEYMRMYRRNFNSILKSLEELKELEETE